MKLTMFIIIMTRIMKSGRVIIMVLEKQTFEEEKNGGKSRLLKKRKTAGKADF